MGKLFGCEMVLIKSLRCNTIQISLKRQITKNELFTFFHAIPNLYDWLLQNTKDILNNVFHLCN